MSITAFVVVVSLMSCKPATKEEVVLEEKLENAKEDLSEARRSSREEEWQSFKNSADSIVDVNDARIVQLKQDMKKSGKSVDNSYQRNIDALELKNKNLKVKMKTFKNDANADWQSFKTEFNHDMTEIGEGFKSLTENNK